MKRIIIFLVLLTAAAVHASDRSPLLLNYGQGILNTGSTPGSYMGAIGSFWNPAGWSTMSRSEAVFSWDDRNDARKRLDNWGVYLGGHGLGAVVRRNLVYRNDDYYAIDDYQLAMSGGSRGEGWGIAYGWSKGDSAKELRQHYLTVGNVYRPYKYVSIGSAWTLGLRNGRSRFQGDLGLRPFAGSHKLTLFGDLAAHDKDNFKTMQWGGGVEVMPLNGVRISAKISKLFPDDPAPWFTLGIGLSVDEAGVHVTPNYNKKSDIQYTSYAVRIGKVEPSFSGQEKGKRVVALGMRGTLTYQKSRWFDPGRQTLTEMLQLVEDAKNDRSVGGIAMNLSGFNAPRELVWELTEKLKEFRAAGKKVYMYVDRPTMTQVYLLTQADYSWMDPLGSMDMLGWLMGGTYYKGMLEKLGIGVEEFRYFTYKSAFERLAREDMSKKDREQRMSLLSDFHDEWSHAIEENLGISADSIKLAMDSLGLITAHEAERFGFVDTVARWTDAADIIESERGSRAKFVERGELNEDKHSDPRWGEYPKVAVVYALGECAMDTGIRARYTSRLLRRLAKDDNIQAVVLRVDSPGGDGLASDLVADGMRDVSKKKPMIVSQGRVAASGGYWLSSPGDRVFTSPFTITGSIGVIAGWLWNERLTEKTGLTFDKVQIGKHADLGMGIELPFIGVEVPNRDVDDEERARVEKIIRGHYDDFVGRVAEDRSLPREDVEEVAQGRVWGGRAAIEHDLVDEIGGLEQSILYAKDKAGIRPNEKIELVEFPKPGLINFDRLFAPASPLAAVGLKLGLFGRGEDNVDEFPHELKVIKLYSEHPGQPLLLLPPEDMIED
ncbi:MAG: S49 family peptidase [Calditrichaeota bacterium]|nr:S49 family peptidase [Calditrichota bacterium]MCB9367591.1 S49 family peptidase [Calditrichota bacterium]